MFSDPQLGNMPGAEKRSEAKDVKLRTLVSTTILISLASASAFSQTKLSTRRPRGPRCGWAATRLRPGSPRAFKTRMRPSLLRWTE
jgi:hypothetical protein